MTSQVQYTQINEHYPVAGKDNNSQGFRNNFGYIKNGLAVASSEITTLQYKVDNIGTPAQLNANNNGEQLLGVVLAETGLSSQILQETAIIDCSVANYIPYTVAHDSTISFINWNDAPLYTKIRLEFQNTNTTSSVLWEPLTHYTKGQLVNAGNYYWVKEDHTSGIMFVDTHYEITYEKPSIHGTINRESIISFTGNIKSSTMLPLVLPNNINTRTVVDVWSSNGGDTIFINLIGLFS